MWWYTLDVDKWRKITGFVSSVFKIIWPWISRDDVRHTSYNSINVDLWSIWVSCVRIDNFHKEKVYLCHKYNLEPLSIVIIADVNDCSHMQITLPKSKIEIRRWNVSFGLQNKSIHDRTFNLCSRASQDLYKAMSSPKFVYKDKEMTMVTKIMERFSAPPHILGEILMELWTFTPQLFFPVFASPFYSLFAVHQHLRFICKMAGIRLRQDIYLCLCSGFQNGCLHGDAETTSYNSY